MKDQPAKTNGRRESVTQLVRQIQQVSDNELGLIVKDWQERGREPDQQDDRGKINQVHGRHTAQARACGQVNNSGINEIRNKCCNRQIRDRLMCIDQERDEQNETGDPNNITKRYTPGISHNNRFTASNVGSMIGADGTACIAARTSLSPLPVFNTRMGSSLPTTPEPTALTRPAYAVAPAGSAKTPALPSAAIAF